MKTHLKAMGRFALLTGLAFFLSSPCPAQSPAKSPAAPTPVTTVEGITEYRLNNGLKVLLFPDKAAATVTVNLTVLVGSRNEGYGEYGMAHLLEHMQFKGTPRFPHVPQVLKEHGADYNATTSFDRTTFFETLPATAANVKFALDLESDRLQHSFIRQEDLSSEMTVVRNEFESGENNPGYILNQRIMSAAYLWHNYGHSTIGNRSDIERVPASRLRVFYHKYYQPNNAILAIGGQFDPATALREVTQTFGKLKRSATAIDNTYTEEPPQDGERLVTLRRVGKVPMVGVVYHIPAVAEADFPACDLLASVLSNEPSGRLYKSLVESNKATGVGGFAYPLHDPGLMEFMANVEPGRNSDRVLQDLIGLLEDPQLHQFTAADVDRARIQWLKDRELLVVNSKRMTLALGEWEARGDWRLFFIERDRIRKVTPEDVHRVADRYLIRSNRTAGIFVPTQKPERAVIPPTPSIAKLVENYHGTQTVSTGAAFDPTPANIEAHVQRSRLPVGLKLALLPHQTRGGNVVVYLSLNYGSQASLQGHTSASQFLTSLMARGTQHHNYQEIQDAFDKLGANVDTGGLSGSATFTVVARKDKLPQVLALLGEILRKPSFPADQFAILKREIRAGLTRSMTEPGSLAQRAFQRRLRPYPKNDVRYVPTVAESIERLDRVTLSEVHEIYTQQLGAQDGELAVVGDFDPAALTQQIRGIVGDWKARTPYQRIPREAQTGVKGGTTNIDTPDKANAIFFAGETIALTDSDSAYAPLVIGDYIFGGGSLSSRLADRVRQKEGLSYTVGSHFLAAAKDPFAELMIFAIVNPKNIDRLDRAIHQELDRWVQNGVTADELTAAVQSYLENAKVSRANDTHLAATLADELHNNRTMRYDETLENRIRALTPAQVNAAVRKYIDPRRIVIVRAGDLKKASSKQ